MPNRHTPAFKAEVALEVILRAEVEHWTCLLEAAPENWEAALTAEYLRSLLIKAGLEVVDVGLPGLG